MTDVATDTTEEALAAGLLGMDASRRVGWAKAFAALERVDALEEELRQTRDELKYLRRTYSRLLGFVNALPIRRSSAFKAELYAHLKAEQLFGHDDAWDAGQAVAWKHRAEIFGMSDDEIKRAKEARRFSQAYGAAVNRMEQLGHPLGNRNEACSCGQSFTGNEKLAHVVMVAYGDTIEQWVERHGLNPKDVR